MNKSKTIRFQFTASPLIEIYVQRLLRHGTFGDSRTEVIRRLVCEGLMNHLGGEEVHRLSQDYHKSRPVPPADTGGLVKKGI